MTRTLAASLLSTAGPLVGGEGETCQEAGAEVEDAVSAAGEALGRVGDDEGQ